MALRMDNTSDSVALHGILFALAFGVFFPAAIIVSRYFKEQLDNTWLRIHVSFITIAMTMILYSVYLVLPIDFTVSYVNKHVWIGLVVFLLIALQIGLGISCHFDHDPDLKEEETFRDTLHGSIGYLILILGWFGVVDGLLRVSTTKLKSRSTHTSMFIAWIVALVFFFALLEYYRGRTSRYSKGNIFAACSQFGAKKLFAISGKQRMGIIDANVVDPNATVIGSIVATPRSKQGALSPFMYRPTWDSGIVKQKMMQSVVPVEQFVLGSEPKVIQVNANPLDRLKDQEALPRSRSNSIRTGPPITPKSRTGSAANTLAKPQIVKSVVTEPPSSRTRSVTTSILTTSRPRRDSVLERLAERLTKDLQKE